jgi:hypothetical protein
MSATAGSSAWSVARLRADRVARGWVPLPESLEDDVVGILNTVVATADALVIERPDTQPASGFEPLDSEETHP